MGKTIPADFGVYAFAHFSTQLAARYYRLLVPLKALYDRGLANIYADDGKTARNYAIQMMSAADIALSWNLSGDAGFETARSFREDMKPIMKEGALLIPPAYILDMDDALEFVSPMNSAYCTWGTRRWDGSFMEPGDQLTVPDGKGGEKVLWKDKVTQDEDRIFDIEANFNRIAQHYEIGRLARGVTVTTPFLASLYKEQGIQNVYVFPNSVIEEDYFFPNLAPHEGVRIIWQGSTSHFEDWMPVSEVLPEVLKENPHAKLVVWGALFPWMKKLIAPEQIEHHGWSDYAAYKIQRPCMDADINLCPLVDTPFNKAKSAIKWYEGSLGPRPEATLAANVGPYQEIEHGKTGLLYNNPQEFKEQLTALIRNVELRKTLGHRAREWVLANRAASKTVVGLYEFYHEIKRQQRMEALAT